MEYVHLGRSGLEVSQFGLGSAFFGTRVSNRDAATLISEFGERGGNLLDTSNIYGNRGGAAEMAIGAAIRGRRHEFVIATKGYWLVEDRPGPNRVGLSRTYLVRNVEASLDRLGTDYIDLFQCHIWDFYTPIDETFRVLDDLVRAGKVRYLGASNWDSWHVVRANVAADRIGAPRIVSDQVWYNLADRVMEHSILPACRDQGVSAIAWGALAQGFLTGRYRRGSTEPDAGSRTSGAVAGEPSAWGNLATEQNWRVLDALAAIASNHGVDIGNIALRWPIDSGACDVALIGGSNLDQVRSLLRSIDLGLAREEIERLREVSEPRIPYPRNFYELFCYRDSPYFGGHRERSEPPPAQ
jgi:aryl-alcohol dehydrogenase-like predicted oxidoreductase